VRLVTYEQALGHLRLSIGMASPESAAEADLRLKIEIAEGLVIDFVNQRRIDGDLWAAEVESWDAAGSTLPPKQVVGAVLVQLGELYRFRGDDLEADQPRRDVGMVLHPRAAAYLYRLRDPAIA
jgi:hypothetical protein